MKHYTNRDFVRLMDAVETDGGVYSVEECHSHEIDDLSKMGQKPAMSTGCEEAAIFEVAYDPSATVTVPEPILIPDDSPDAPEGRKMQARDDDGRLRNRLVERKGEIRTDFRRARVCANDDLMRLWPRFAAAMKDPDPMTGG